MQQSDTDCVGRHTRVIDLVYADDATFLVVQSASDLTPYLRVGHVP